MSVIYTSWFDWFERNYLEPVYIYRYIKYQPRIWYYQIRLKLYNHAKPLKWNGKSWQ